MTDPQIPRLPARDDAAPEQTRNENVERFVRAIEQVTGMPFEILAELANAELEERQKAARYEVLQHLGESAVVSPEEADQIRREWQA